MPMIMDAITTFTKGATRGRRAMKHARLRVSPAEPARRSLLHIIGCQRSGTTMFTELLDRDPRIRVHGELESLFDDTPRHHRLRDVDDVRRRLARTGASIDVVKPLVESHRVDELTALVPGAVALWMFRRYDDVASSNLRRFGVGNGVRNLRAIVDDAQDDWRNAGLSGDTRELVRDMFDPAMDPHDAAALFWYCRNTLVREQRLQERDDVRSCRYEHLVERPGSVLAALYDWLGLPMRVSGADEMVRRDSVGRGSAVDLSAPIRRLCDVMWDELVAFDELRRLDGATP
jgi:hypothetical protein